MAGRQLLKNVNKFFMFVHRHFSYSCSTITVSRVGHGKPTLIRLPNQVLQVTREKTRIAGDHFIPIATPMIDQSTHHYTQKSSGLERVLRGTHE